MWHGVGKAEPTHRVILQFLVVHVDDIGADSIQEILGMGHKDQDALETAKPRTSQEGAQNPSWLGWASRAGPEHFILPRLHQSTLQMHYATPTTRPYQ